MDSDHGIKYFLAREDGFARIFDPAGAALSSGNELVSPGSADEFPPVSVPIMDGMPSTGVGFLLSVYLPSSDVDLLFFSATNATGRISSGIRSINFFRSSALLMSLTL